jgi:hypothetical protein
MFEIIRENPGLSFLALIIVVAIVGDVIVSISRRK